VTDCDSTAEVRAQIVTELGLDALPTVLDASQVARVLSISRWSVYELARGDLLPVVRLGRTLRFPSAALVRLLNRADEARSSAVVGLHSGGEAS
jgi:excisionase family DNA binding protein